MSFNSFSFAIFFAIIFLFRVLFGQTKQEKIYLFALLIGSLIFYGWDIPWCLLILFTLCVINHLAGIQLGNDELTDIQRRYILIATIVITLAVLFLLKYYDYFFLNLIGSLIKHRSLNLDFRPSKFVMPIGVSFYTFQIISYTIDVYRRRIPPLKKFWPFFLYVSFFPQLVAGPIVRAKEFIYQIGRRRRIHPDVWGEGFYLLIRGLFLKTVIADNLNGYLISIWNVYAVNDTAPITTLLTAWLFSAQIFADFAGYSSIARGIAYLLGFRLPVNFDAPYISSTFSEFWKRWHITLGAWFKDYLYIPLGGNRRGRGRTYFNLFFVMFLAGLWHGAAMTFVLWGVLHGTGLILERFLKLHEEKEGRPFAVKFCWFIFVQFTVLAGWILFRSAGVSQAGIMLSNLFKLNTSFEFKQVPIGGLILTIPVILIHLRALLGERLNPSPGQRARQKTLRNHLFYGVHWIEKSIYIPIMVYLLITCQGTGNAFIYFQF